MLAEDSLLVFEKYLAKILHKFYIENCFSFI